MILIKKIYLSIITFGIISILLTAFVIWPLFKEITITSQNLFLEKNKIIYLNKERENLQKIKGLYEDYQSDLDKIKTLFIDPEVPIEFISFLETNASTSQIKLEISSITKKTQQEEPWPSFSLQLLVAGSFSNLLKFLEKIENGLYLIEIFDLNTKKLTEKEKQTKELENIPEVDTTTILSIKVFTE